MSPLPKYLRLGRKSFNVLQQGPPHLVFLMCIAQLEHSTPDFDEVIQVEPLQDPLLVCAEESVA